MSSSLALAAPRSSIGSKYLVAVTGLGLSGFVLIHMLGNLQVFLGRDQLNHYAEALKANPGILWTARLVLLAIFVVHIGLALRLKLHNRAARPAAYVFQHTEEASFVSRNMVITGLAIFFFVLYHLAHFTLGLTDSKEFGMVDAAGRHDVYGVVVHAFSNPIITGLYILAMIFLGLHMIHGVQSSFQSLGLTRPHWEKLIYRASAALTFLVVGGNIFIPLAIFVGIVK
jgi:succinate dehydrogenase / fumarate reductase, cytochrome b subunit